MDIHFPQAAAAVPAYTESGRASHLAEYRDLIEAVRTVNAAEMLGQDNELSFLLDRETQRLVLRIVNRKTLEVIRQVPPEYVLAMARHERAGNK